MVLNKLYNDDKILFTGNYLIVLNGYHIVNNRNTLFKAEYDREHFVSPAVIPQIFKKMTRPCLCFVC
jgi:hypothetical protein